MKVPGFLSRIIVGLVFIFSGTVKAIDPLGSAYKFHDYFQAFHLAYLDGLSLPLAIILCTAEFIGGFSVLTGIKPKAGIWIVLLLMLIFTPLTLVLAIANPVSDCGCFGDAVHLTNWQTFWKNVVLLTAAIILFAGRGQMRKLKGSVAGWIALLIAVVVFVLFSFYNLKYLPVIDFLPYKTGVNIESKMVIPEGATPDTYNTTFIYEKDGVRKEFTLSNYPANDTSWKFIDQKSVLVKKGYQPPIHDFSITTENGEDITGKVLETKGYTLLMTVKKLGEADSRDLAEGFELGRHCIEIGMGFYVLTASGIDEQRKFNNGLPLCSTDETTLKTMVRSNPGFMLLNQGTIIGKWSSANCPDKQWFDSLLDK